MSAQNPGLARATFLELYESQPANTINVFTGRDNRAACAFTIPSRDVNKAWKLPDNSSIFSAELAAIRQALDYIYNFEIAVVNIFSDSLASVMAIHNQRVDSHHLIKDIRQTVSNLLSSGTRTNFIWIPSHVTIPGNERADELATQCLSDPVSPSFDYDM
ncbi:hypothetical protein DAPPUDRAFT_253251 [Daphnia pulex]|uniref:RNase H type-1 domain-containing protein n=1 Tax=Daphnia pulex TaxID=6669 RepID=E9H4E3_DAPPU|nr:hypothetical protein DAPPUDRAFT_253251 [Daphnia pulex]|eukprot:EFX73367.1 hypothetical protein DAPPUDRAFT_253251 [Daphnia pulex]